jgi:hypothetical protein
MMHQVAPVFAGVPTNEHYAMQFVEEEGTRSSLQGVATVIREHGLFSAFYCDRAAGH